MNMSVRVILVICVAAWCAGCSPRAQAPVGRGAQPTTRADGPHYLSEAQRNRAQHYWLPQNVLPPDAPVLPPGASLAAAQPTAMR